MSSAGDLGSGAVTTPAAGRLLVATPLLADPNFDHTVVLLLDADNFAAVDPQYLFDTPEYRETGAIFWPDIGRIVRASPAWSVFGVPYRDEPEFETGQILVDKAKCWKALCLTKYYNDYSDFYYQYVYGDKETFHFAFHRVGQPYAMTRHPVPIRGYPCSFRWSPSSRSARTTQTTTSMLTSATTRIPYWLTKWSTTSST